MEMYLFRENIMRETSHAKHSARRLNWLSKMAHLLNNLEHKK